MAYNIRFILILVQKLGYILLTQWYKYATIQKPAKS